MNRDDLYTLLLKLISKTSPHPTEREVIEPFLPKGGSWDGADNYIYELGKSNDILFAAHMDTVGKNPELTSPIYKDSFLYTGSNADCLGGDDRCGVFTLLSLIEAGIPGTYIFHNCEERGAVGAEYISKNYDLTRFKKAIEFDRRGVDSVITQMSFSDVCSIEFAHELIKELDLGYKKDPTGSFTDVYNYKHIIPEVTNLSVGYFHEHSSSECIAALWLIDYFIPAVLKVNWEDLPTVRIPSEDFCNSAFDLKYNNWNKAGLSYYKSRDNQRYSKSIDEDWELELLKQEEEWDNFSNKSDNKSIALQGSCDCCGEESEVENIDEELIYCFCEKCKSCYKAHIKDVEERCYGLLYPDELEGHKTNTKDNCKGNYKDEDEDNCEDEDEDNCEDEDEDNCEDEDEDNCEDNYGFDFDKDWMSQGGC